VFECDDGIAGVDRRGLRKQNTNAARILTESSGASADDLWESCGRLTPGIVGAGQDTPLPGATQVEAVDTRDLLARVNFFECLTTEALGLYEGVADMTDMPTTTPSSTVSIFKEATFATFMAFHVVGFFLLL
jgi:hypothetical protein